MSMSLDRCDESSYIILFQRSNLFFVDFRKITGINRIELEFSDANRLIDRFMENTIDILDCLRRETVLEQLIVKALDLQGGESR